MTFLMMGIDKYKARKGKWRISERALLLSGAAFGACGAFLGMIIFHHKNKTLIFLACIFGFFCAADHAADPIAAARAVKRPSKCFGLMPKPREFGSLLQIFLYHV